MNSILISIKNSLGISYDVTAFDSEIIQAINSALMLLNQLGIGPEGGLVITSSANSWSELLAESTNLELVKSYVYLRTKLLFDSPTTAHLVDALERQLKEFEWRLIVQAEPVVIVEEVIDET